MEMDLRQRLIVTHSSEETGDASGRTGAEPSIRAKKTKVSGLMRAGHFTGIDRSVIAPDAVVQTSMGLIADRPYENLSQSDGAVAQARRLLLNALATAAASHPPGSALAPEVPRIRIPSKR
jgi:LigXa C-terminal domain like